MRALSLEAAYRPITERQMKTRVAIAELRALNTPGALVTASFFNLIIDALDDLETRIAALERTRQPETPKRPRQTKPARGRPK
jgi:shikimate 5-dehydrogenase